MAALELGRSRFPGGGLGRLERRVDAFDRRRGRHRHPHGRLPPGAAGKMLVAANEGGHASMLAGAERRVLRRRDL